MIILLIINYNIAYYIATLKYNLLRSVKSNKLSMLGKKLYIQGAA